MSDQWDKDFEAVGLTAKGAKYAREKLLPVLVPLVDQYISEAVFKVHTEGGELRLLAGIPWVTADFLASVIKAIALRDEVVRRANALGTGAKLCTWCDHVESEHDIESCIVEGCSCRGFRDRGTHQRRWGS
jgi:hypothetical protein